MGDDVPRNAATLDDNAYTVVLVASSGDETTIDGLMLAGGHSTERDNDHPEWRRGGAIHNLGTLTVANSTISGNSADYEGGGIWSHGSLMLTNSTVVRNQAHQDDWTTGSGGGIYGWGELTITSSTISESLAEGDGGGIYNRGELTITNSTIAENEVDDLGGGIYNSGMLMFTDSTVSGNSAENGAGGIWNSGTLTLTHSSVFGNSAFENDDEGRGGGVLNEGALTVTNSIIVGNQAHRSAGGILNWGEMTITNSTLVENYNRTIDNRGHGIASLGESTITNSILALDSGGDATGPCGMIDDFGNFVSGDPLFIRNPDDGGDGWGDNPYTWPYDGGANDDFGDLRLSPNSPAINRGDNQWLPTDEFDLDGDHDTDEPIPVDFSGNPRTEKGIVDIGAHESSYGHVDEDPYEPNNALADAYTASFDWQQLSLIAGPAMQAGEDWYAIDVPVRNQRLTVDLTFTHAQGNINLAIVDATCQQLASSTSDTDNEQIDTVLLEPGTWFIRVSGDNAGNMYDLVWNSANVHPGDADLSGATDLSDFNIWNANKFVAGADWSRGDFNGDGNTDLSDFNIWNAHKFTSLATATNPVPPDVIGRKLDDPISTINELAWPRELEQSRSKQSSDTSTLAARAVDRLLAMYWK